MKQMKQTLTMVFILTLSLLVFGCGQTETSDQAAEPTATDEKPTIERSSEVTVNAVVEAVDYDARTFTLTDELDNTQTFTVQNPSVPLQDLKAGDNVTMIVYEEILAFVTEADVELPPAEEINAVGKAEGQITVTNIDKAIYTVKGIDVENRTADLESDDIPEFTLPIRDDVKNLENVKIGDKVLIYTTHVVSVSVNK